MHPAASASDFIADPIGRYFAGRSFVVWAQTPSRLGSSYFVRLDPADFPSIQELFALPLNPALRPPYDVLHDLGAIEVFDRNSYAIFEAFLRLRIADVAARVSRLAVVRPPGLAGAAFSGLFHEHVQPAMNGRLFAERAAALEWLGLGAESEARQQIERLTCECEGLEPPLRSLRHYLAQHLRDATLERAAEALCISARSLQRRLGQRSTSFRDELTRARVRAAEGLLLETDDKIEAIALCVGFASPPAFTSAFTRIAGTAPAAFREQGARGPGRNPAQ